MEQIYIVNVVKPYVVSEYIVWADNGDEAILAVMDLRILLSDTIDRPTYSEYSYRKLPKKDWLVEHDATTQIIKISYQPTSCRGLIFNLIKNKPLYFSGCKS